MSEEHLTALEAQCEKEAEKRVREKHKQLKKEKDEENRQLLRALFFFIVIVILLLLLYAYDPDVNDDL